MVISCPACHARYRIDPATSSTREARVKCPACANIFTVRLDGAETVSPPAPTRPVAETAGTPVVLVVDDARFFREMIGDILKELPVTLVTAADGDDAWQQIVALRPALVLLDLNIPGMSGKELIRTLRQGDFGTVRVLAMSGVERGAETAAEVRRIGADDFIGKSFKPRELQDRVRAILGL